MSQIYEKTIEILKRTADGNNLDPLNLKLLEDAVNGRLNDNGKAAFDKLHTEIVSGTYKYPWFHGIENMRIDNEGNVYWKEYEIENYGLRWAFSHEARKQALELENRCIRLETRRIVPSIKSVIWDWED